MNNFLVEEQLTKISCNNSEQPWSLVCIWFLLEAPAVRLGMLLPSSAKDWLNEESELLRKRHHLILPPPLLPLGLGRYHLYPPRPLPQLCRLLQLCRQLLHFCYSTSWDAGSIPPPYVPAPSSSTRQLVMRPARDCSPIKAL